MGANRHVRPANQFVAHWMPWLWALRGGHPPSSKGENWPRAIAGQRGRQPGPAGADGGRSASCRGSTRNGGEGAQGLAGKRRGILLAERPSGGYALRRGAKE
jgi:hypothetical protein